MGLGMYVFGWHEIRHAWHWLVWDWVCVGVCGIRWHGIGYVWDWVMTQCHVGCMQTFLCCWRLGTQPTVRCRGLFFCHMLIRGLFILRSRIR